MTTFSSLVFISTPKIIISFKFVLAHLSHHRLHRVLD
uniref:Uncharacterized protein n=1 Tax=Rhizophora mucronata TaxID=61149 RepID=A0A2P2QH81_RHIMU